MSRPTPLPGRPVRGSRSGRPVMALLDLLGRRWTLRLLWELREGPVRTFRELQERCGDVSSSVLADRLRELAEAGVTERTETGYGLTDAGVELLARLAAVGGLGLPMGERSSRALTGVGWTARWSAAPKPQADTRSAASALPGSQCLGEDSLRTAERRTPGRCHPGHGTRAPIRSERRRSLRG